MHLSRLTWTDVPDRAVLLVPVGSTEQHGPHLPFDTDTTIAEAVADEAARILADRTGRDILVAPAVAVTASGEHEGFPGTLSIGHDALVLLLVELIRSASRWTERIVLVNAHGGNVPSLVRVVEQMTIETHRVAWVPCVVDEPTDAHAGLDETALMLHLAPHRVDMSRAGAGRVAPLGELLAALQAAGVRSVSASGVIGDPRSATAELGRRLFEQAVAGVVGRLVGELGDGQSASWRPV